GPEGPEGPEGPGGSGGTGGSDSDYKQGKSGERLPSTATNVYQYVLLGLVILVAGFSMYYWSRRKANIE
ncbi:LPXTG cell wall anchor domain-containing protein, partial [Alkalihalobacillus trypoxylicola]